MNRMNRDKKINSRKSFTTEGVKVMEKEEVSKKV